MLVRELRVTYRARSDLPRVDGRKVLTTREAVALIVELLDAEAVEVFGLLCLSTRLRLIGWHELSRGTLDATVVHPRDVFRTALLVNAASVIVAHCHPSGDPAPSEDDIQLTKRVVAGGELLGIQVLEHVIVGHDGTFFSFRDPGLL